MTVYRDTDLEKNLVRGGHVAILGYGNQGHAHAMNLRDNGVSVVVGARPEGIGYRRAAADGFEPFRIADAVAMSEFVAVLLPDEVQGIVFERDIRPALRSDATLIFAHGFSITFDVISPPPNVDVVLVAPKVQGHYLRKLYQKDMGVPCLIGVAADVSGRAQEKALSYAQALGCLRAGAIATTFQEETVTDLFGEQAVLCGGVPSLVRAAFETLVSRGYDPDVAYIECLHELKIITDLMHQGGIAFMRERISRTAAWGSFTAGEKLISPEVKARLERLLDDIESGEFAKGWIHEATSGQKQLKDMIRKEFEHPIERAGGSVRSLMPYLKEGDL